MRPARCARSLAITLALLTLTSACTGGEADNGPSKTLPSQSPTFEEPKVERLTVDPEPLWRSNSNIPVRTLDEPAGAQFLQESLVLQGSGDIRLAVVDAATGKPRWTDGTVERQIDASAPYGGPAPVVRRGEIWEVLLRYSDCSRPGAHCRNGIASVAGEDGRARWRGLPPEHLARGELTHPEPQAADGKVAVSTIGDDRPIAWAVDVSDGSTLWDANGVWPQFMAAGMVLGVTSRHAPAEMNEDDDKPYVTALDARSGKKRWDLKGRYEWSKPKLTAGNVVLVVAKIADDPIDYQAIAFDARTGEKVATLGASNNDASGCASDGHTTIACQGFDYSNGRQEHHLVTFDVETLERHVSPAYHHPSALFSANVDAAWGDYIFVNDGKPNPEQYRAVDRDGNVVSGKLPGRLVGMSDKYAVFTDLVDSPGAAYAVYRVAEPG